MALFLAHNNDLHPACACFAQLPQGWIGGRRLAAPT
jgi:hypothetical protein